MFQLPIPLTAIAAMVVALSGCASINVPPSPEKPAQIAAIETAAPQQFFNAEGTSLPMTSDWWSKFNDPLLTQLIETALSHNKDLDVAQANIQIAQASLARQQLETSYSTSSNVGADAARC